MKKTVFILCISLFGLSACSTTEAISHAGKADGNSTQPLAENANQQPVNDKSGLYAKLVRENGELSVKLKDANNSIAGLQAQVQHLSARLDQQKTAAEEKNRVAGAAEVDLDVYARGLSETASSRIENAMKLKGFHPKHPELPKTMTMSRTTTVYYYDSSFIPAAGAIAQDLANILNHKVVTRKGASLFAKNKIVVHMRGR